VSPLDIGSTSAIHGRAFHEARFFFMAFVRERGLRSERARDPRFAALRRQSGLPALGWSLPASASTP